MGALIRAALLALALASPAQACRLALSLAIDVSASVDAREFELTRKGLAAALVHDEVADAFLALPASPVRLHVFEWSGRWNQTVHLDWTEIRSRGDLARAARQLAQMDRTTEEFPTAVGPALVFGALEMRRVSDCAAFTIDVSGDGVNNDAYGPGSAYRAIDFSRIVVNGLVIGAEPGVWEFYRDRLIRGPGAFVTTARDFEDFERAMVEKLVRELSLALAALE